MQKSTFAINGIFPGFFRITAFKRPLTARFGRNVANGCWLCVFGYFAEFFRVFSVKGRFSVLHPTDRFKTARAFFKEHFFLKRFKNLAGSPI